MGTLMVLRPGGGCRYYGWSEGDEEAAGQARFAFDRHRARGYVAYELVDERRGSFVASFNAAARLIVMHAAVPDRRLLSQQNGGLAAKAGTGRLSVS